MANEILVKAGTAKVWKASGGDYAMTMASIAVVKATWEPPGLPDMQ
jgi:hypothetical protein